MVATTEPREFQSDQTLGRLMELVGLYRSWAAGHQGKIRHAYLVPERGGSGLFVVQKEPAYDFELSRDMSSLCAEVVRRGFAVYVSLVPGSVATTVPADAITIGPGGEVSIRAD